MRSHADEELEARIRSVELVQEDTSFKSTSGIRHARHFDLGAFERLAGRRVQCFAGATSAKMQAWVTMLIVARRAGSLPSHKRARASLKSRSEGIREPAHMSTGLATDCRSAVTPSARLVPRRLAETDAVALLCSIAARTALLDSTGSRTVTAALRHVCTLHHNASCVN